MDMMIQITAGRGPAECCQVVARVLKILLKEAAASGLRHEVLAREPGELNGTLQSALVKLEGENVQEFAKGWLGTVQWVGKSEYRPQHRRKNWYIGVEEVAQNETYHFNDTDVQYQAMRSGGPGGQHVNKVSSAVRATHVPTGLSVVASDSRSQHQNKKLARQRLEELLRQQGVEAVSQQVQEAWQQHNALQRGNPVRVFRGSDFKKQHVDKGYKRTRLQNKQDLRKGRFDD